MDEGARPRASPLTVSAATGRRWTSAAAGAWDQSAESVMTASLVASVA
jgi:hypothetical protein